MLAALLLAGAAPDLPALDRRIADIARQRAATEAPLLRLTGTAAALARMPAAPERDRRLFLLRAWLRVAGPPAEARLTALRDEQARLAIARARLVLRPLLPGARFRDGQVPAAPLAPCATAVYRPPVDGLALTPRAAAALGHGTGLALLALPGASVSAPAAGWIAYAGPFRRYGDIVVIDHGHGWTTLLTGLSRLAVRANRPVAAGAPLGQAGGALPLIGVELTHRGRAVDAAAMTGRCA